MNDTKPKETTALEVRQRQDVVGFSPRNLNELWKLCTKLAGSGLVPTALKDKPQDLMILGMHGRDLGLSFTQALYHIHVIEGRPTLSADIMVALCEQQRDICEYFMLVESTPEAVTFETKRRNHPKPTTFTVTMAQMAQVTFSRWDKALNRKVEKRLVDKDNWRNFPDRMLIARCKAALARLVYPDVVGGFYTPDELEDLQGAAVDTSFEDLTPPSGEEIAARIEQLRQAKAEPTEDPVDGEVVPDEDAHDPGPTEPEPQVVEEDPTIFTQEPVKAPARKNGGAKKAPLDMTRMAELRRLMGICATAQEERTETYRPAFLHSNYGKETYGDLTPAEVEDAIKKLEKQARKVSRR